MGFYQLDYIVEQVRKQQPSRAQISLKSLTGTTYDKKEAAFIWERILNHKWFIGERLKRDVGLRVAAIDYIENFHDENLFRRKSAGTGFTRRLLQPLARMARSYFLAKSRNFSY